MAKVITAPPRFTHEEWTRSNLTKYANADVERAAAERLVDESKRLADETEKRSEKSQRDVNKKLQQRIDDIKYWKKELDDKLDGITTETDNLGAFKNRVEKALEATEEPLHIARQCLANRERRKGIDLVHDDVQKELIKEVETLEGVQALLNRTLEQATEQIRLNRKAKYLLEKDLKDKFSAVSIDEYCENLKNNSADIRFKDGVAKIEANSVSPEDWQDFSNDNIENAERERQNSVELRTLVDGILQQTANDMRKQCSDVNLAFTKRIAETKDTKGKLEDNLNKVLAQIKEMEENITRLKKAIADKDAPLMLAQTRLDTRAQRPNVELCRDPVQYRLIEEVGEIEQSIARLQDRLNDAVKSMKGLVRNKQALEEDIEIKANTIFIDEVECMGMRKSINIQSF
ncbi:tektin-1-like [Gigantopelta aegis]|uniref:tektin-1-like n=1 Tax=Gigantopelta aegis TaxID=1735272 RepID=UPI001B8891FC|nr:tektin-1-like [Gigantopelta aegis]XP_041347664.1 tektin-1-like [Gigantopelta aegis]